MSTDIRVKSALLHNENRMYRVEANMEISSKDIGLRIKKLRRQKNMTQIQLAEKLYYTTERQIQRIENGENWCPTDRLAELAVILDTSTDYLLFGKDTRLSLEKSKNLMCRVVLIIVDENYVR